MWATSDGPRIEDFGISERDLAQVPKFVVAGHRTALLVGVYLIAASGLFFLLLSVGGSWSAAAIFTVIVLAAVSVLLLPAAFLAVCAGERAEERWLCRRFPALRACLAYQEAVAEHRRRQEVLPRQPEAPGDWSGLSHTAFVELIRENLDRLFGACVTELDRESSGCDFMADSSTSRVLVRCEPGSQPIAASIGRELTASVGDFTADAAVIVTSAMPTRSLEDYIAERSVFVVAPGDLEVTMEALGFPLSN